ncbi:hypothetical protein J6590_051699 [Homalodisca vitripennis]|nr:hypothetical protein J6590_051699 [Homalodisca vitripennis]
MGKVRGRCPYVSIRCKNVRFNQRDFGFNLKHVSSEEEEASFGPASAPKQTREKPLIIWEPPQTPAVISRSRLDLSIYPYTPESQNLRVSCRKAAKNYKEELQKRFCANYSSDVSNTRSIISKEIFDNNIIDSSSPILQVQNVSFDREVEGFRHHTSRYEVMQEEGAALVFRRGQPFSFVLHFNRAFNPEEDYFHLQAEFGHTPLIPKGTKYKLPLSEKSDNGDNWEFSPVNQSNDENEFKVQVKTPSNCQVGLWKFALFTYKRNSPGEAKYTFLQDFYILFNPWNESDQVFLEDEEKRQEYVLNDHGKIWMGTNKAPVSYPWVYGQFDLCVLPVVTLLLAGSDIPPTERGSAVIISRALSALVNSYDDEGLLVGKWVGTFDDGTKPFSWTGSIDFFNEFLTSSRSVKYAQCWVFAGALATGQCRLHCVKT